VVNVSQVIFKGGICAELERSLLYVPCILSGSLGLRICLQDA
jgi:hypothetical protein